MSSVVTKADDTALAFPAPRAQAQAFGLAYALETADLQAVAYTRYVQRLKEVSDPQVAGAEVAHLSSAVPPLRHAQAAAYAQASALLNQMGAPLTLRDWANRSAVTLNAPLVYAKDAQKQAKTEPDTAAVLAELSEIRAIKASAEAQQTPMTLWLELIGGKVAPWTADVGAYAAGLRQSSPLPSRLSSVTAQMILLHAPPGAPAQTRETLAALIPTGGGNLQNMSTAAPANVTPAKMIHVYETLLTIYHAEALAKALSKSVS